MLPEDIDDLFRDKLDGHASPPGDALWARLQAAPPAAPAADAAPERLDHLFHKGLNTHATPPSRALWERLEDEHLRPRKRRAAAWWPLALAAAVALLLVAGGAGLWLGFPLGNPKTNTVASQQARNARPAASKQPHNGVPATPSAATANPDRTALLGRAMPPQSAASSALEQKNPIAQATRPAALASTAPKARMSAPGPSPRRHPMGTTRQPDAAADHRPLVARTTAPMPHPGSARPTAADEQRLTTKMPPAVALAPSPAPAAEIVPAPPVSLPSLAHTGDLITVDVRNGSTPVARPTKLFSTDVAAAGAPEERRRLGGRLLQQAGHLARGERISLAEVTGLPENVTLRATVAGRSLTKSIQL